MGRRATYYDLYNVGTIDPTYKNIWGFSNAGQRNQFLNSKLVKTISNVQYWRPDSPIKVEMSLSDSYKVDYVRVINDYNTSKEKVYYCFVTAREYVSPDVTRLALTMDIPQTYYFNTNLPFSPPFWSTQGFINKTTTIATPSMSTPSDYPVKARQVLWSSYDVNDFDIVIFCTLDLKTIATGYSTISCMRNGVVMTSAPYLLHNNGDGLSLGNQYQAIMNKLNTDGRIEAVSNVCVIPKWAIPSGTVTGTHRLWELPLQPKNVTVPRFTNIQGYTPNNPVLLESDYTVVCVTNNQGDTQSYRYEEFNGLPNFSMKVEYASGNIQIICEPTNLKGAQPAFNGWLHAMKIPSTPLCTFDNDTYKIWLAQTANTRTAAINAANNSLNLAKAQREANIWYQLSQTSVAGEIVNTVNSVNETTVSKMAQDFNDKMRPNPNDTSFGGMVLNALKGAYNNPTFSTYGTTEFYEQMHPEQFPGATTAKERTINSIANSSITTFGSGLIGTIGSALAAKWQLETNADVQRQQDSLNQLMASYKDKAVIPPTVSGSNSGGDRTTLCQVGFWIWVSAPATHEAQILDKMMNASGITVNQYNNIVKAHKVYDYFQVTAPNLTNDTSVRPFYARNLLISMMNAGIYVWHAQEIVGGTPQIPGIFGSPYNSTNPKV